MCKIIPGDFFGDEEWIENDRRQWAPDPEIEADIKIDIIKNGEEESIFDVIENMNELAKNINEGL